MRHMIALWLLNLSEASLRWSIRVSGAEKEANDA